MDAQWRIQLLGGLVAVRGEESITRFRSQRTAILLAYLAYYRSRRHPRQVLIEILWPGCDAELGRHNLSVALSRLRDQLKLPEAPAGTLFDTDRFAVGINPEWVTTDVAEFETTLQLA